MSLWNSCMVFRVALTIGDFYDLPQVLQNQRDIELGFKLVSVLLHHSLVMHVCANNSNDIPGYIKTSSCLL